MDEGVIAGTVVAVVVVLVAVVGVGVYYLNRKRRDTDGTYGYR